MPDRQLCKDIVRGKRKPNRCLGQMYATDSQAAGGHAESIQIEVYTTKVQVL